MRRITAGICGLLLLTGSVSAQKRPMVTDDLFAFKRVADPQISPNGETVVYQLTTVSLAENKSSTNLWLADVSGETAARQLTATPKADRHPRWSPNGKSILFESTRSGEQQLWIIHLDGGEAKQITTISTGAGNAVWSPDGKKIAFVSAVYPEFSSKPFAESDRLNRERMEAIEKNPVKAKAFTRLFYRHWVEYVEDKRQHIFVCDADGRNVRDVTPGDRDGYPTSTTFSVGDDFTFTPDSTHLIITAVPAKHEAWSTNYDLCRISIDKPSTEWETLTKSNPAADGCPRFSPDGKKFAWRAQKTAGYEADKWDIMVADCTPDGKIAGPGIRRTADLDESANEFSWLGSEELVTVADSQGENAVRTFGLNGSSTRAVLGGQTNSLSATADGKRFACANARMSRPFEVLAGYPAHKPGSLLNVSRANKELLSKLDLPDPESVSIAGDEKKPMQMWILNPPGFDAKKKWPVVYLVHGGPQSAWEDGWSYRWNAQAWAAQGYVVVMPNPRGSTGFGQKYVDEISGDWGGKCYRDLVQGLEYVKKLPYVDKDRIGSAGASFGGYMMNWFAVSPIAKDLKCLITHCSVWNFESMWGTTDELWFDEYEHGGLPWEKPQKYAEFSPHKKAGELGKNKVPMLIIHNDLDFRCPIGQGHELFSALQRQGVPSRFVNFPDEGHWVTKPKNSAYWHQEVFGWLKKYVPPGPK